MDICTVNTVYDDIASHFDETRYSVWKCLRDFLDTIPAYSLVGDIGCGNGKNTQYRKDLVYIANDICKSLLHICRNKEIKNSDYVMANGRNLPYRNGIFDYVLSIAVIHHLESRELRREFIRELMRCLKLGGRAFVTVWAYEQPKKKKWVDLGGGDFIIPWTHKKSGKTHNRFYHLFSKEDVEAEFDEFHVVNVSFEKDNYHIMLEH